MMRYLYLRQQLNVAFWPLIFGSILFCLLILKCSVLLKMYSADNVRRNTFDPKETVTREKRSEYADALTKQDSNINEYLYMNSDSIKNWTILLTVNNAYFDFFRNWYFAYHYLDLNYSIIIVAEDELVYKKLQEFKSETVTVTISGRESVQESASYGSAAFSKLVSGRPSHILKYLNKGINILYSDIDMVWIQSPFPYFTGDFDMWMELDDIDDFCTGLMAIKSNKKCVKLMEAWEKSLQEKVEIDQTAFNKVVKNATIQLAVLDNGKFPTGVQYFEKFTEDQRRLAVVVHNNWIVGQKANLRRFQKMRLWFISTNHLPTEFNYVILLLICIVMCAFICELKSHNSVQSRKNVFKF